MILDDAQQPYITPFFLSQSGLFSLVCRSLVPCYFVIPARESSFPFLELADEESHCTTSTSCLHSPHPYFIHCSPFPHSFIARISEIIAGSLKFFPTLSLPSRLPSRSLFPPYSLLHVPIYYTHTHTYTLANSTYPQWPLHYLHNVDVCLVLDRTPHRSGLCLPLFLLSTSTTTCSTSHNVRTRKK